MALLEWGPGLEVGFGDIDVQHRRLVDILNRLAVASSAPEPREATRGLLEELTAYTQVHFAFEEHLMDRHGIGQTPQAEAHIAEHRRLVTEVQAFRQRFTAGDVDIDEELLNFLRDWLADHILGTDRELARTLRGVGATSAA